MRTDMTKLIVPSRNFAKSPNNKNELLYKVEVFTIMHSLFNQNSRLQQVKSLTEIELNILPKINVIYFF
jgi:hypothetical protein